VSKFELTAMIDLPSPLVWAFSAAAIAALGLITRCSARAAASARIPDPVPTSATLLPAKSILDKKSAKNLLVRKYRG
jgi:hypothetical protein